MRILKTVLVEKVEATSIVCNRCGMSFDCEDDFATNLIHNFDIKFGYGSEHDFEKWDFDLCEKCVEELVDSFKFKPAKFEIGIFGESTGREIK